MTLQLSALSDYDLAYKEFTMDRSIIHLNVADFAVAVERAVDCRLKDRPVIIAPEGAEIGRASCRERV